jgi:hypothetical protein
MGLWYSQALLDTNKNIVNWGVKLRQRFSSRFFWGGLVGK